MADPGRMLRRAMRDLLEHPPPATPPPALGYSGLVELYGSNAGIADAAGIPTAAQAISRHRARYPHARKTTLARIGADARRRRQSFLRNLQRYGTGSRRPRELVPLINRLRGQEVRRRAALRRELERRSTLAGLAGLFEEVGVTVLGTAGFWVWVSRDYRYRSGLPDVPIEPEMLEGFAALVARSAWEEAAAMFFEAWGQSYGIGFVTVDDVEVLELEVGS